MSNSLGPTEREITPRLLRSGHANESRNESMSENIQRNWRIDVHHHVVPPQYADHSMPIKIPDVETQLQTMDEWRIQTAITSLTPRVVLQNLHRLREARSSTSSERSGAPNGKSILPGSRAGDLRQRIDQQFAAPRSPRARIRQTVGIAPLYTNC